MIDRSRFVRRPGHHRKSGAGVNGVVEGDTAIAATDDIYHNEVSAARLKNLEIKPAAGRQIGHHYALPSAGVRH